MDRAPRSLFIESAADALTRARGTLLLQVQGGAAVDLDPVAAAIHDIAALAQTLDLGAVAKRASTCGAAIHRAGDSAQNAYNALDRIAEVEAELLDATVVEEFSGDLALLVDGSFDEIIHEAHRDDSPEFAIDAEILEIFRTEGEELLSAISIGIDVLAKEPANQNALWDIRRSAHTFKGAAGIVGLTEAASLAHGMEDLLDRLVESNSPASNDVVEFLRGCVRSLGGVLDGAPANSAGLELAYSSALASLSVDEAPTTKTALQPAVTKLVEQRSTVRVSLERLTEIMQLAEELLRTATAGEHKIAAEMHEKLVRIRLTRFNTLETRLARVVSNTAHEEGKKAVLEIETPDVEIDTLILDALVEPLIHLLKNAVVHGIETPEMRRLLGKHEFGLVSIRVEADGEAIVLTVTDDGAGISGSKLKQRAVEKNVISQALAAAMSDHDAHKLLFDKGLTTADKLDLNAGRGIGMGIVKESIESRGGSVHVDSTPQLGTTFTLLLPVNVSSTTTINVAKKSHAESDHSKASPPLVLVVDDSASIRRHNQKIVENAGLRCITAEHGADALEILLNGSILPDLILSDVEMPHVDGWQLLEYIKTDEHMGSIPVILVTSLSSVEHRSRAAESGASDYIVKPLATHHLTQIFDLINTTAGAA